MTTLKECLDNTSDYDHAEAVRKLHAFMYTLGNAKPWMRYIMQVVSDGLGKEMNEEATLLSSLVETSLETDDVPAWHLGLTEDEACELTDIERTRRAKALAEINTTI